MAVAVDRNGKKWIQASVAIFCIFLGFVAYRFFNQLNIWFSLEAMIPSFKWIVQGLGALIGLGSFIYIMRDKKSSQYLSEVYSEFSKVVFPERQMTNRHTVVVMIGVLVIGFVLGFFDWIGGTLLGLLQ